MWLRILEQKIESTRKRMEDASLLLGLGHPKVYQLSQELDGLHNLWEKESARDGSDTMYAMDSNNLSLREEGYRYRCVV